MKNLLKYIFYKTLNSRVTWVLLIIQALYVMLISWLICSVAPYLFSSLLDTDISYSNSASYLSYLAVESGLFVPFMVIFTVLIFGSDYSTGYIKNFYGTLKHKFLYPIAYIIVSSVYALVLLLISEIVAINVGLASGTITFDSFSSLIGFNCLFLLLIIALNSLLVFFMMLIKKLNVTLIIALLYTLLHSIPYLIITLIIDIAFDSTFTLSDYTLFGNISSISLYNTASQIGWSIGVSIVCIAFSVIMTTLVFKKRDVK